MLSTHIHLAGVTNGGQGPAPRTSFGGYPDPLRDHRAVVGDAVHTPWYIKVRALILLILIIAGTAAAIAGFILLLVASGRIVLEILAGE